MDEKRKEKHHKHPQTRYFFKVTFITLAIIIALGISTVALMVFGVIDVTSNVISQAQSNMTLTSVIYSFDSSGNPVQFETLNAGQNRVWAPLGTIPDNLQKAVISIEDQRFYQHGGVDFLSTTKAAFLYVLHKPTRGGSTITQQLIKNITGNNKKTAFRKLGEIVQAMALERKLTKDQVLELYLNTIYTGEGCNGVLTASEVYFDKPLDQLTLAECALIAGITQLPSQYDPYLNLDASTTKRNTVLEAMLQQGYITQKQYDDAINEKVNLAKTKDTANINSYFGDQVVSDVLSDLKSKKGLADDEANKLLFTGGLQIYATVDPNIQKIMETVFADSKNFPKNSKQALQPESAMAIIDPSTGAIRGLVGGRGTKTANRVLNRATSSFRQPGSSIKPISVYGPGIDMGLIQPNDVFTDKPVTFGSWSPGNSYSGFRGNMTVRHALEQSVNTVAAQIENLIGPNNSYNYLKNKFGISSLTSRDNNMASMALGGLDIGASPLEMAAAYSVYANNGTYTKTYTYTKVLDNTGHVILENKPQSSNAVKISTAKTMNSMLHSVVTSGIASSANFRGDLDICGKTGTTNDNKDRWFVGYTPYYAGAVWFGYDQPQAMNWLSGSNPALVVWKNVMVQIHKGLPAKRFNTSGVQAYNGEPSNSPIPDDIPLDDDGNPIVGATPIPNPNATTLPFSSPKPTDVWPPLVEDTLPPVVPTKETTPNNEL